MLLKVDKNCELLNFLYENIKNVSKNNIKSFLTNDCVFVNNHLIKKYNYILKENDNIFIITKYIKDKFFKKIDIIYEDNELIVVNKPYNLLTIATAKEKERTLYNIVSSYVKKRNKKHKIFIIHRLDKDTSGIILFAKNQNIQKVMQENWNDQVVREYLAMVSGQVKEKKLLKDYISINKIGNSFISSPANGKIALTNINPIKIYKNKTLLNVDIKTGRKNQIRLQLSNINHPIIGDKKYNGSKGKRLLLHAYKIEFNHPLTNKKLSLTSPYPQDFIIKENQT